MKLLKNLLRGVHAAEDTLLALSLLAMLFLAFGQIVLRNLFDTSIVWADPMIRVMVLWIGMLGALAATRDNRQISIDVVTHLLKGRPLHLVRVITRIFAAVVCGVIGWHSARFVIAERSYETIAFAGVPAWMLQVVIPVAFTLMAFRYLLLAIESTINTVTGKPTADDDQKTAASHHP